MRLGLKPLGDLERLTNRVASGSAQPRDLVALRQTLERLPALREALPEGAEGLEDILAELDPCQAELELLQSALADDPPATLQNSGVIRPGYSAELDGVVERSRHAREWIANLEGSERQRTGIKSLKVGYNKVFGYYIEMTRANTDLVPADYIRKQTLVNAERYITPEMKEYEALVLNAEERIREIEGRLFRELLAELGSRRGALAADCGGRWRSWTCCAALAEAAASNGYTLPGGRREDVLEIREGRHPVVELSLSGERFVPNDLTFEAGERIRILTGPNMCGKIHLPAPGGADRADGADGQLRAGSRRRGSGWWTASSPASARRTRSTPGSPPSWWRWSRPPTSCTTPRRAPC